MVAPRYHAMWARERRSYGDRRPRPRDEDEDDSSDFEVDDSDDEEEDNDDVLTTQSSPTLASAAPGSTEELLPPPPPAATTPGAPLVTTSPAPFASTTPFVTSEGVSTAPFTSQSVSTLTVSAPAETSLVNSSPASSVIFIGQQDGNNIDNDRGGVDGDRRGGPPHDNDNHNKFAIAFGVIGAVGFLVGLIWAALLIRRRRRRRRQDQQSPSDYASGIGKPGRSCKLPSLAGLLPRLPFGRHSSSSSSSDGDSMFRRTLSMPFSNRVKRSDSSIMDEAMRAVYGTDGDSVPQGFLDEKKHDPNYPLPLLEPEPIFQASIRQSIANWFKRSSGHHPLKLNPMSRWSRSTRASTVNSQYGGGGLSSRTASMYSASAYSVTPDDITSMNGSIPPVPPLNLQRQYTGASNTIAATPTELASPEPVFTRDDAKAYYKTMWASESERMSTTSSWTDATRSTMRASAGPPATAGLSPPSYHLEGNSNRSTLMTDVTTTAGGGTAAREELYNLYAEAAEAEGTGSGGAGSGMGLQRFDTMGQK